MIYKLRYDRFNYLVFEIMPDEVEEKLGDYFILDEPLWTDFWKPLNAIFFDDSDNKNVITPPDITCWFIDRLVLNEKAYQLLSKRLAPYGELLPVKCEGVPYWVLHITKLTKMDAVDEDNSERVIEESSYIDMKRLVFKEDKVKDLLLFKTEFDDYKNIYCSEQFKGLVEDAGLEGLVFSTDLASIF